MSISRAARRSASVLRGNLMEQYKKAMTVYRTTIDGAKELHGKDFYEAQLRVVEAHFGFEQARQDVLDKCQFVQ